MNTMKKTIILTVCAVITAFTQLASAQENKPEVRPFQVGIVYPLSTNGTQAPKIANVFSVNGFMGMSAGVEAAEFSGFMSITNGNVNGVQGSGFLNINRGNVHGAHGAGFCNISKDVEGIQASGFCNMAKNVKGVQASGFINLSDNCKGVQGSGFIGIAKNIKSVQGAGFICIADTVTGIQASGFANVADQNKGVQATGFINISGDNDGMQGAGFMNTSKNIKGVQIAGFLNIAKDIDGAQIAGFLNKAQKVKGSQISGFLNIADSSNYPIGIINLVKNGTKQLVVETDENTAVNVIFKSGGRYTYGIIGLSYLPIISEAKYGIIAGIGGHLPISTSFAIDADLVSNFYYDYSFKKTGYKSFSNNQFRLLFNYKINNRISIFAGPKLNLWSSEIHDIDDLRGLKLWSGTHNHHISHYNHFNYQYSRLLLGASAGIEINLK